MDRICPTQYFRLGWIACSLALFPGCFSAFSQRNAREVSRDRLLQLSEQGHCDHLQYVGSDFSHHYVFDSRQGEEKSYKVTANSIKLAETFPVGEDSYVLHPWVIEGKPLGTRTDDDAEALRKSARHSLTPASGVGSTPQSVVESTSESDLGEEVGDDQIDTGSVETP
ncbi:MAG: hypothetical protein JSS02_06825 [Planctomycetes bacterium]|nr:hypothetical protein [Planctomycetota bacterium]